MEIFNVSGQFIKFIFTRLRMQEKRQIGKISSLIEDELLFKFLLNIKYKEDHNIVLTDLEQSIKEEAGIGIRQYVNGKYDEAYKQNLTQLPFSELSFTTVKDLNQILRKTNSKMVFSKHIA